MLSEKNFQYLVLPLLAAVVVMQGYFFVQLQGLRQPYAPGATPAAQAGQPGPGSVASQVVIGDRRVAYNGTITQLDASRLVLKTADGSVVTFALSAQTKYVKPGTRKTEAEFNRELADYNAKVKELLKEPVKNADALKTMNVPVSFNQVSLALSDFKVGDDVYVTPGSKNSDDSYSAVSMALNTVLPQ